MFTAIKQIIAVTALNLRTIPARLGSSAVGVVGIAGVVVVFVSVLSIAAGFSAAMQGAGSPTRAIITRSGADDEMSSILLGPEIELIKQAPGIMHEGQTAIASGELFVILAVPKKTTGTDANVPMRGIEPTVMKVRTDASLVAGRMLEFGTNEVIVGRGANNQFVGLNVGDELRSGQQSWKIVGIFEQDGGVSETEIWCDARTLQGAYRRGNSYQSVLARLEGAGSFDAFKDWLTTNKQLSVNVRRESDYYISQSRIMTQLINGIGIGIGVLMGLGAVFGAILTMYTAVASRTREIATLRALGFNRTSVVISVLGEALALGAIGGALGGALAYFAFNGYQTSTMNFQTFSQVAFAFLVTPALLMAGLTYALALGLIGGLFPAIRAARLPIPSALREL